MCVFSHFIGNKGAIFESLLYKSGTIWFKMLSEVLERSGSAGLMYSRQRPRDKPFFYAFFNRVFSVTACGAYILKRDKNNDWMIEQWRKKVQHVNVKHT